jgi:hypothetical protein
VAVDAKTGREVWRTQTGDPTIGETTTGAPLVVRDKVMVGNSGGEFGVRGWLQALDVGTGLPVWKAYSTGSDADALRAARRQDLSKQRSAFAGNPSAGNDSRDWLPSGLMTGVFIVPRRVDPVRLLNLNLARRGKNMPHLSAVHTSSIFWVFFPQLSQLAFGNTQPPFSARGTMCSSLRRQSLAPQ